MFAFWWIGIKWVPSGSSKFFFLHAVWKRVSAKLVVFTTLHRWWLTGEKMRDKSLITEFEIVELVSKLYWPWWNQKFRFVINKGQDCRTCDPRQLGNVDFPHVHLPSPSINNDFLRIIFELFAFSRISCNRQLIHSRLDVHLLRPVRSRSTYEQIFVVEEIFDHHSTGKISNTFTKSQTLWLVDETGTDCVIWLIAPWWVPFASDSVQRRLSLGLQRASHWLRVPTVDAAHALLVHGVLPGKAACRDSNLAKCRIFWYLVSLKLIRSLFNVFLGAFRSFLRQRLHRWSQKAKTGKTSGKQQHRVGEKSKHCQREEERVNQKRFCQLFSSVFLFASTWFVQRNRIFVLTQKKVGTTWQRRKTLIKQYSTVFAS